MAPVKVISQQPPGGRCTLYARYADAIADGLGWSHRIVHGEERDAHGNGFPSLWIGDAALQPEDFFMLTPADIRAHLAGLGIDPARLDMLERRLQEIHDEFVATATRTAP